MHQYQITLVSIKGSRYSGIFIKAITHSGIILNPIVLTLIHLPSLSLNIIKIFSFNGYKKLNGCTALAIRFSKESSLNSF
jgi:hypothetical protein